MSTLTSAATLYTQKGSSWYSGYARQGKYSTTIHRGLMVFPELANDALTDKIVTNVSLTLVSSGAGNSFDKTAGFYVTDKTASGGSSTAWIQEENYIGNLVGYFYNRTTTFPDMKTSNPELFAKLKAFLENGGQSLAIFRNENVPSGKNYSTNYLSFTSVSMTVEYVPSNTWRYDGSQWTAVIPWYYNGSEFVRCDGFRHDGSKWSK